MKWRCRACGRLSPSNVGGCECGARAFERTVVRMTKRCTTCGSPAPADADACEECGFTGFEPLGEGSEATGYLEWSCARCGNEHPKHAPPCDRCGHDVLERVRVDTSEFDVDTYVDGTPWWTLGFSKVQAFGIVLVVGVLVLFLAGLSGVGPASGLVDGGGSMATDAVERGIRENLNHDRTQAGLTPLSSDETLVGIASEQVDAIRDGESTDTAGAAFQAAGYDCDSPLLTVYRASNGGTATGLSEAIADSLADDHPRLVGAAEELGVTARTVDGDVYVAVAAC